MNDHIFLLKPKYPLRPPTATTMRGTPVHSRLLLFLRRAHGGGWGPWPRWTCELQWAFESKSLVKSAPQKKFNWHECTQYLDNEAWHWKANSTLYVHPYDIQRGPCHTCTFHCRNEREQYQKYFNSSEKITTAKNCTWPHIFAIMAAPFTKQFCGATATAGQW